MTGAFFNTATGQIYGSIPLLGAGTYDITLTATNADGNSAPVTVAFGILATPSSIAACLLPVNLDLATRASTLPGNPTVGPGDQVLFGVSSQMSGTGVNFAFSGVTINLLNPNSREVLYSSSSWQDITATAGATTTLIAVPLTIGNADDPLWESVLDPASGGSFTLLGEIVYTFISPLTGGGTLTQRSALFSLPVSRVQS